MASDASFGELQKRHHTTMPLEEMSIFTTAEGGPALVENLRTANAIRRRVLFASRAEVGKFCPIEAKSGQYTNY
ncbi:MAG TPA: hypothetical protein VGZ47_12615 [Gemmataceae bacterium]|nr:hypothetical protein [Gemmataceae bacterium]